jgi:hypothetical protein
MHIFLGAHPVSCAKVNQPAKTNVTHIWPERGGSMAIYRSRPQFEISTAPDPTAAGRQVHTMLSTQTVAAAKDETKQTAKAIAEGVPTLVAAGIFLLALWLAVARLFHTNSGPEYHAAAGIGAFALFYIAAQAAERVVEFFMPLLGKIPPMNKPKKAADRDLEMMNANQDPENAGAAANAQAAVDQAVANRRIVAFALTAALGMLLCSYLEADFLSAVGVTFGADPWWAQAVQVGVTGLVVGGGSVGLHDLIGNVTKSSKAKDDPEETGGTK